MQLNVQEAAGMINARIAGDPSFIITGVSSFTDAGPADITFAGDAKHIGRLEQTQAGVIIIPDDASVDTAALTEKILLYVEHPKISFFRIVEFFFPPSQKKPGIHPNAHIGQDCTIGADTIIEACAVLGDNVTIGRNVRIMPGCYVGDNAVIADDTLIKPNVTIMERTRIGKKAIIHSNSVIGSDGYGFAQDADLKHQKLIHTGYVIIGDNVEIGAGNTIDRGTLGTTVIGNGVKTDNQVHIAHNVKIGDNTLLVAQVGIAGSTTVGKNVIIAGKAGITGHINIGDNTIIGPYAGVYSDVGSNQIVSGIPHMEHKNWLKMGRVLPRLPEMRKQLLLIEKRLKTLEKRTGQAEQK